MREPKKNRPVGFRRAVLFLLLRFVLAKIVFFVGPSVAIWVFGRTPCIQSMKRLYIKHEIMR